ncbi:MAG: Abortive infection protein [Myxococcaceae bacterium]|nr:Abortive infection protein [Myxococcaceae bacterium]
MNGKDDRSVPAFGALALLVLAVAMMYGLTLLVAALYGYLHELPGNAAMGHIQRDLAWLTLIQWLAMGTALVVGLKLFDPEAALPEALSLQPVPSAVLGLCLLSGVCLQFPLTELANALHAYVFGPDPLEHQLALQNMLEAHSLGHGILVVVCLAALVPLIEELLFRGLFLFGLERRYGPGFALLLSACFFGVVHLGAVPAVYATVAGLVLGALALHTRSIWPGVALHAAINAVPIVLPESLIAVHGFNVPSLSPTHLSPWLVWPPLFAGLGLLATVLRIEYAKQT